MSRLPIYFLLMALWLFAVGSGPNEGGLDSQRTTFPLTTPNGVRIDPKAYANIATRHGQPSSQARRQVIGLAILFSLGLLLTLLSRRHQSVLAASYCLAWILYLGLNLASRPTLHTREEGAITWYYAQAAQTVRINIPPGSRRVPVVESLEHARSMNPRIEMNGGQSVMVLEMKNHSIIGIMAE